VNITLGICAWRSLETPCVNSLLEFQQAALREGFGLRVLILPGDGLISRARSRLASIFLRTGDDVLLSIDSDIGFKAADALKVCREAVERSALVGGMYLTRSSPSQPALPLPADQPVTFGPDAELVAVDWLVTGFLAIPLPVVVRLSETMPLCDTDAGSLAFYPMFQPVVGEIDGQTVYLSEDFAFVKRARDAGFGALLDPSVHLVHYGHSAFALDVPTTLTRHADGSLEVA
jgi:hypothetical protein